MRRRPSISWPRSALFTTEAHSKPTRFAPQVARRARGDHPEQRQRKGAGGRAAARVRMIDPVADLDEKAGLEDEENPGQLPEERP